eukprot:11610844-Alexandrium_andersonii.AAC.1
MKSLSKRCDDLPHLAWYIGKTINGGDPPMLQLHERMETTWWHFAKTWNEEVIQPPRQGQGRRKRP